ncbi:MAG: hypothetical protein JXB24_09225 [Bacteroidales bacterium]|nr:hypothetical protein [Bacteroidales bacterium]
MRIFILCTGRSGSFAFIKACKHILNYSSGHETNAKKIGSAHFEYSDNHIEADNRLIWFLGALERKYADSPVYVHLKRNKSETIRSLNKRWHSKVSIMRAYCAGILKTPIEKLNKKRRLEICEDYYNNVNLNIEVFLKSKSKSIMVNLETIQEDFRKFWNFIGARGNLENALIEFETNYNKSKKGFNKWDLPYEIKLFFLRLWRKLF